MNLPQFLKKTDQVLSEKSREELLLFIHELARELPERQREDFLQKLTSSGDTPVVVRSEKKTRSLQKSADAVCEKLSCISKGESKLTTVLNELYDDWYNSDVPEVLFEDPKDILGTVDEACSLLHTCYEAALYDEVLKIGEALFSLRIPLDGEYVEDFYIEEGGFSLKNLEEEELYEPDYETLLYECLYAAYATVPMNERPGKIYHLIQKSECAPETIRLEKIIQRAPKEPSDFSQFLKVWSDYLLNSSDKQVEVLLNEALSLQNDPELLLQSARQYFVLHPGLYEKAIGALDGQKSKEELLEICQEAVQAISVKYLIRSRISLLAFTYAKELGRQDIARSCLLEAFRSDTRPVYFIKMADEFEDYRENLTLMSQILRETSFSGHFYTHEDMQEDPDEFTENKPTEDEYYLLLFFTENFDDVIEEGMHVSRALGWTYTFMKSGLALFLLLLYEGSILHEGGRAMCRIVLPLVSSGPGNRFGIGNFAAEDINKRVDAFWEFFKKWKKNVTLTEEEAGRVETLLERRIDQRVDAIMKGNKRNIYGECADFIAALGEMKESRGEPYSKKNTMDAYRAKYSRRSAFKAELKLREN